MLKIYRNSKLSTRIISFITFASFAGYIAHIYNYDWLLIGGSILGFGFILEAFIVHTKLILTSAISFLNILVSSLVAFAIYEIMRYNPETEFLGLTNLIVLQASGIIVTITVVILSYLYAQGKTWVNALTAFIIYNTVLFVSIINSGEVLDFTFIALLSVIVAVLYVVLRIFIPLRHQESFDFNLIPKSPSTTVLIKNIKKRYPEATVTPYSQHYYIVVNQDKVLLLSAISVTKSFTISKKDIEVDGVIITGMLEAVLLQAQKLSHDYKISQKYITPVLYVTDNKSTKQNLVGIRVRKKNQPDRTLGVVSIATENGLDKLFKTISSKKTLTSKTIQQLQDVK